jgi:predicted nucleic acid-binding protein
MNRYDGDIARIKQRNFVSMIRGLLKAGSVTIEIHDAGINLAGRYCLAVYDAMIVSL